MASLVCSETGVVCISGTTFAIISIRDGALERQDIDIEEKRLSSLKENAHEDNGKVIKSATDITSKDGQNRILACKFSPSWRYFAACDDAKRLYLFQCGERWKLVSNRAISRRCTVLTFTKYEQDVLVADKWGDVFRFSVTDPQKEGLLLLGHLSMLLDILTTKGDKYVVTTDRDNKIRISEYPNSYNIHTYCLHHTEYVSSVVYNEDPEILLSGSGDGTIVIWDLNGKVVSQTTCSEGEETLPIKKLEWEKDLKLLSVIFFNSPVIQLYMLAADSMSLCRQRDIELTSPVWDACFDRNGQLWVLQKQEGDTLQVYTCQKTDSGVIKVGRIDPELPCSENKVLEMFNKDWTFFSVSESAPDLSLEYKKKETPNNYSIYLQKKQDRINQTQPAEPQAKKVKTT